MPSEVSVDEEAGRGLSRRGLPPPCPHSIAAYAGWLAAARPREVGEPLAPTNETVQEGVMPTVRRGESLF
jgi:hypothetical protein